MEENRQLIEFTCVEAQQPIGSMYVGVMDHDDLEYISFADVRRLELGVDNREVEDYIGIQRELNSKRENEIGKYVNLVDATFPNSIIIAISSEYAEYDSDSNKMTIQYKDDVAKVLDGQHRIAGLRHFKKAGSKFQVIVTIYIDMELEDQAIVFSTINKEQKNVSNSLVADLFAFARSRSPQKTAHNIARALNSKDGSPFYHKIKILGTARRKDLETITQDTFVKNLIKYISKDPQSDRDFYKRNEKSGKRLPLINGSELEKLPLRNLFIEDESDLKIAQLIFNYFHAVQRKWPNAWNELQPSIILNRSTGFIALMRFFKPAYLSFELTGGIVTKDQFYSIFEGISLQDDDFNKERYVPGSTGQGQLYRDLLELSSLQQD
ncbi:MAG: DGQHR domain-containing protein [Roseivirga sp.]|uniref:DGQHR domain-containing protein n=1 Tax=Roseivirga sp. TaxID=1964215 RepID=UPI001B051AA3|nr:DGQHR domain-containing protein [Roseivirga sp.]MBO6659879.1 DGQHR domain-containing protein [Roseivirga sp.]MBO6907384.1 DGQHR domain-containing protein [Roseivirga sp.]